MLKYKFVNGHHCVWALESKSLVVYHSWQNCRKLYTSSRSVNNTIPCWQLETHCLSRQISFSIVLFGWACTSMGRTSWIYRSYMPSGYCSIWWNLCVGVQLKWYEYPDTSKDDSDKSPVCHYVRSPFMPMTTDFGNSNRALRHTIRWE